MVNRPYILVETFLTVARPFMIEVERPAIEAGILDPAGGHETWMRTMPWILLSELSEALRNGDERAHEDAYARICMRLLGIPDGDAEPLLQQSLTLVNDHDF